MVSLSPCKQNITLLLIPSTLSLKHFLQFLTDFLVRDQSIHKQLYCRRYKDCADLYFYFKHRLGPCFTQPVGVPDLPRFCLVDMYMSCTEEEVKEEIVQAFTKENSTLRIVWYGDLLS